MSLFRLLLLFALGWFAWRLLSRALNPPPPPSGSASDNDYQRLTRCSVCGTYIPQSANGAAPVCEACRRKS